MQFVLIINIKSIVLWCNGQHTRFWFLESLFDSEENNYFIMKEITQDYFVGDKVRVKLNNGYEVEGVITKVDIAYSDDPYFPKIEDINYDFIVGANEKHWCYPEQILGKIE